MDRIEKNVKLRELSIEMERLSYLLWTCLDESGYLYEPVLSQNDTPTTHTRPQRKARIRTIRCHTGISR